MCKYWFKIMTVIKYNDWQQTSGKEKALLLSYYITAFEFIYISEKEMQHKRKMKKVMDSKCILTQTHQHTRAHTHTDTHTHTLKHPVEQCSYSWDVPTSIWPWKGHVKISFLFVVVVLSLLMRKLFHGLNFSYRCEIYCPKGHVIVRVCESVTQSHTLLQWSALFYLQLLALYNNNQMNAKRNEGTQMSMYTRVMYV